MLFLKKYPKHFLLMISCAPFILVGLGAVILTCSGMSIYYIWGISCILAGLKFPITTINNYVMRSIFKTPLNTLDDEEWIGLLLEDRQTSEQTKLVPDDFAVITKEDNKYYIITSNQTKTEFRIDNITFTNTSKNDLFCSINCIDQSGNALFPFMISPVYTEDNWCIASSGQRRFEWFMNWLKCETEELHDHSEDEILHQH